MTIDRIVVFTSSFESYSVRRGIAEILARFPSTRLLCVEHAPPRTLRRVLRNQVWHLRREKWRWLGHAAATFRGLLASMRAGSNRAAPSYVGQQFSRAALERCAAIDCRRFDDIHSPESIRVVQDFAPDLGLSLAAPILKPTLFELPRLGTINLHKGKLPDYRGMPPAFWEIWNGESEVGCSVHQVTRGLDQGPILARTVIPVERFSTIRGLQIALDEIGIDLVCHAVAGIASGQARYEAQPDAGTTYRKPTLKQWAEVRRREPGHTPLNAKTVLKEIVYRLYVSVWRPLPNVLLGLLGRQRITVLLYHRVCDALRDPLTVGVEQFERQVADMARRCQVVSLDDVIAGRVSRRSIRPIVAVTFDDGYRDNFAYAAPVLLRHGVPAAFFVCTELVGTARPLRHDLDKLGFAVATMDWDEVGRLREWGFTVGSHTQTHVNCAKDDPEVVAAEILGSKRRLEMQLGLKEVIFAYPFGKRDDFNEYWREFVRRAGYVACLSAYGGSNRRRVDRFNVVRTGISHAFPEWAFRARLEGWG